MGTMKTCHEMLVEIKAATELGEIALAKRLDISQPTVNRILTTLIKIMRLHEEVCGQNGNGVKRAAASDDTQPPVGGTSGDEKMSRMVA
jgi:hypothetical protein